jgi:hypothetical protein
MSESQTQQCEDTRASRKAAGRIEIFRATESRTLQEAGMMHAESPPEERKPLNSVFAQAVEAGTSSRVLFSAASGFSLVYAWFKSHYPLPVHSHNTPCLYYVISGELTLGTQKLGAGDGFFVPACANYSYQAGSQGVEVLEFRDTNEFDFVMRSGTLPMWERMAAICNANLEHWKSEAPPIRRSAGLG